MIVDHDDFVAHTPLGCEAAQAIAQARFFIARRDDDRNFGMAGRLKDGYAAFVVCACVWMSDSAIPLLYYKSVKRLLGSITLLLVAFLVSCNSGSHPPRIGSTAPDFAIKDSHQTVTLSQLRGKPVVLNFWATWCPPCIEEMPSLLALHKQLGDQVTILTVSEDADDAAFRQFIRDHGVDVLAVRDTQHNNEVYGTFKFPETYIIDRNGKIVRKFIGATNWTSPDLVDYLKRL